MTEQNSLKDDLDFVRAAVIRGRRDLGSAPIYFLWAAIIGIGFVLPDFAPRYAGPFWLVAGLGGGLLSMWLGYRHASRIGVRDPALGWRQGQHWLATGAALAILVLAIVTGHLPAGQAAPGVLAMVGLSYTLAGVHLNPPLRWAGGIMLIAAAALLFLPVSYLWTATGLGVAAALFVGGLCARSAERND